MYRVLIVDDEQLMCDGLVRILSKIPQVSVAATLKDGFQAKKYLEKNWVDIVFADIRMPGMDGLELAKYLSVYRPDCMVVLISAYNEFSYAQQAIVYGVKNYLMKPVRLPEVKKVIEQLLQERENKERNLLWNHDLKQEILELEMYHALISGANPAEKNMKKKLFFSQYAVYIDSAQDKNGNISRNLLQAAWTNIFRWCAPLCIPVLIRQDEQELDYTLLAEEVEQFPDVQEIAERGKALMEIKFRIQLLQCSEASELLNNNPGSIAQDEMSDEIIVKAKEYIRRNLSLSISRSDVADAVHLDSSYFSKYFKKKCGINFHDYLLQERINRAKEMLENGYKVRDAAEQAGFQNRNYFNQIFKQYTGQSPSDYKKEGSKDR